MKFDSGYAFHVLKKKELFSSYQETDEGEVLMALTWPCRVVSLGLV